MTAISHHISDETLQDYAAGTLNHELEVVIACHMTLCPACRARSSLAEAFGGAELSSCTPTATTTNAADLLDRLDEAANSYGTEPTKPVVSGEGINQIPMPLQRLLPTTLDKLEWKRLAPGIKQHNLSDRHRKEGAFKLLNLSPGVVLSKHTHHDRELTLVLQGSYQDEIGRFKAGDIADFGDDVMHQPVVDTDKPCIALIATMSPVRYSGMFGRIIQPFVGI